MNKYKVLILDIDGTVISWEKEYWSSLDNTLKEFDITYDRETLANKIDMLESIIIKEDEIFSSEKMIEHLNKESGLILPKNFFDVFGKHVSTCAPSKLNEEMEETLKYLSSKYKLIGLTNWFIESQKNRMKKCGVLKYFEEVYGADNVKPKPNIEAFKPIFDKYLKSECIIIGDGLNTDIKSGCINGFDTVWFNRKNMKNETQFIPTYEINSFKELKNLF